MLPLSSYGLPWYSPLWTIELPTFQSVIVSTPKNHFFISSGVVNASQTLAAGALMIMELSVLRSCAISSSPLTVCFSIRTEAVLDHHSTRRLLPVPPCARFSDWTTRPRGTVPLVVDWRLELVQVPVSDVDRAKAFYTEKVGFNLDHDHKVSDEIRFVQLTPRGSACSIALGTGLGGDMHPGAVQGLQLVVSDIHAARAELVERGVECSEVQEFDWGSFVFFSDPDGNAWNVQQTPA